MAQIIREIRVDVSQPNVFQAIVAKQLDCNSRFLKITLVDFGVKIEVPETAKVTINANRPDGKSQSFVGVANNDGTITVPLAQWMLEVAGELKCDVSVINTTDNKRLTSTDFYVNVQEAANKSTDISENPDGEIRVITPTQKIDENSSDDEYPSAKAVYDFDNITATATGSAITIDSAKAPLQNLKLFGKTEQNGTPTPDAPVPLVSVGDSGSFEVGVYNSNLLNIPVTSNYQMAIAVSGNKCTVTNTQGVQYNSVKVFLTLPKGDYVIKADSVTGELASGQFLQVIGSNGLLCAFNSVTLERHFSLAEQDTINVTIFAGNTTAGGTYTVTGLRLCEKSMLGEWEPYTKQTLTMPYTLRSVNEFKDELNFDGEIYDYFGKGVHTQKCILVKGCFTKTSTGTNTKSFRAVLDKTLIGEGNGARYSICSHTNTYGYHTQDKVHYYVGKKEVVVYVPVDADDSIADELEVLCVLETPIETPITETDFAGFRQIRTNKGATTILCEAEAEVDYYRNNPNAQAIGNIHDLVHFSYFKLYRAIIETGGSTL